MILDLPKFIAAEKAFWTELETILDRLEGDPLVRFDLEQSKRFHYLYERAAADLARISTFSAERELRAYLESLVARAYAEIHETRQQTRGLDIWHWFYSTLPQTFRRHVSAFFLALAVTLGGSLFGGFAIALDPAAKPVLLPFSHLLMDPAQRVAEEEKAVSDRLAGSKSTFSTFLMTHNIKVSLMTLALGMTYGLGTMVMLFYNGIILGAVATDYVLAGQSRFLAGWLLPHGSVEIPAILLAGQIGLLLGATLIGRGQRLPLKTRFRAISQDIVTLASGLAVFLIWAGLIEAFLSQYHEPFIPYAFKIAFGVLQLGALILFLGWCPLKSHPSVAARN